MPNPHPDTNYVARFTMPEFTSICPVTGQPDFAILVIDYVPRRWLVESKSLKLYLNSFRNEGAFHEDCTVAIGKRLVKLLAPRWLRIGGYFYPRGGMPIDVFWQAGKLPARVWAPDQGVAPIAGGLARLAAAPTAQERRTHEPVDHQHQPAEQTSSGRCPDFGKPEAIENRTNRLSDKEERRVRRRRRRARAGREFGDENLDRAVQQIERAAEHHEDRELHLP